MNGQRFHQQKRIETKMEQGVNVAFDEMLSETINVCPVNNCLFQGPQFTFEIHEIPDQR